MEKIFSYINDWTDLIPILIMGFMAHKQAMKKLDAVIESNHEIKETVAVHNTKLDNGEEKMQKLEVGLETVRDRVHSIAQEVHVLKGRQLTHKQVELLIETKAK